MTKIPYRNILVPCFAILTAGTVLVSTLSPDSTRLLVTVYMILIGLGIGASFSVLGNTAIHGLPARQRGTASSTLNFVRSLGMTIGITVFGIIQSRDFIGKMSGAFGAGEGQSPLPPGVDFKDPHSLLSPATRANIPDDALGLIASNLSSSVTHTFAWAIIPVALALIVSMFMGRTKLDPTAETGERAVGH
jgi:hypothetical protein